MPPLKEYQRDLILLVIGLLLLLIMSRFVKKENIPPLEEGNLQKMEGIPPAGDLPSSHILFPPPQIDPVSLGETLSTDILEE